MWERKPGTETLRPLLKITQPSWDTNQLEFQAHTLCHCTTLPPKQSAKKRNPQEP